MSEKVEKRMELMTGEFEEMARINLFNSEEIRTLTKKRRDFEYKIGGVAKNKKSYLDYIDFEKLILKDIKLRRKKYRIAEKRSSIEQQIHKRVKLLYEVTIQRFPDDASLVMDYVSYCRQMNIVGPAADALADMVKIHSDDPKIWQVAANWHAYDCKDANAAIILLAKGLNTHKGNTLLYKEMLEIELSKVTSSSLNASNKKQAEEQCLEKLNVMFTSIFTDVDDCDYYINTLEFLQPHAFTIEIQEQIIDKLEKDYYDNENVWHTLAQCARKGLGHTGESQNENADANAAKARTPRARFDACFAKYKYGLTVVGPQTKPKLWNLYLDFLLELQQDTLAGATVLKREALKDALKTAAADNYLSEKHYMAWLELVNDKEALEIVAMGTTALPNSIDLWKARLRLQILGDRNDSHEVDKVFKMGIEALKENSLPLWSSIIRYHYLTSTDDLIQSIYEDGVKQAQNISDTIKPQYIQWLTLTKGIEVAREVYKRLSVLTPYCKDLHLMMSKLESLQIDYDFDFWEQIHKLACEQFATEDVDVWISYIQFYLHFNKNIPNINECIQDIYKRAESSLPMPLFLDFRSRYNSITESA